MMKNRLQKFRSPIDGRITTIEVQEAHFPFVLWKHIQQSFGDVKHLRAGDRDVHCMISAYDHEDYIPLRIEYFPDVILDVILNEKPPCTVKDVEEVSPLKSQLQALSIQPEDDYIRYGSTICFRHVITGGYVRSLDLHYEPDPDQFVICGVRTSNPGQDDWWEVVVPTDSNKDATGPQEQKIPYGSRVRISHTKNGRWLHSNKIFSTSVSKQQIVTTYGCRDTPDGNIYWVVEKVEDGTEFWRASDLFILRHESTNKYLHSNDVDFGGEKEITAIQLRLDMNNMWRARLA
ncbi:Stromal cell-derived factor 2-like protein 1 [Mortierella sp. AM989]|nr:Stromal cell-derived factor 2-like protein 1 [Mortierella sp. AM989]